ncbi:MAG: hypothetical protein ACREC6_15490 [Hyphomicrobiaceae bacterium]
MRKFAGNTIIFFLSFLALLGVVGFLSFVALQADREEKSKWIMKETFEMIAARVGPATFKQLHIPLDFEQVLKENPGCCGADTELSLFNLVFGRHWEVTLVLKAQCKGGITISRGVVVWAVVADDGDFVKFRYMMNECPN